MSSPSGKQGHWGSDGSPSTQRTTPGHAPCRQLMLASTVQQQQLPWSWLSLGNFPFYPPVSALQLLDKSPLDTFMLLLFSQPARRSLSAGDGCSWALHIPWVSRHISSLSLSQEGLAWPLPLGGFFTCLEEARPASSALLATKHQAANGRKTGALICFSSTKGSPNTLLLFGF